MEKEFMDYVGDVASDMRLLIEGTICIYEGDALILCQMARENGLKDAVTAWDTIGNALYELRNHIRKLQQEHTKQL